MVMLAMYSDYGVFDRLLFGEIKVWQALHSLIHGDTSQHTVTYC
jgi:hypothetical protein